MLEKSEKPKRCHEVLSASSSFPEAAVLSGTMKYSVGSA